MHRLLPRLIASSLVLAGCDRVAPPLAPSIEMANAASPAPGYTTPQDLGWLAGGYSAEAIAVNENGWVVGWSNKPFGFDFEPRAVLWPNGPIAELGTLPGHTRSRANDINRNGVVVGQSCNPCRAFRWNPLSGMKELPAPGYGYADAAAVNDAGLVAGRARAANGQDHAVRWTATGFLWDLHPIQAIASWASAIDEAGNVYGGTMVDGGDGYTYYASASWDVNGKLSVFNAMMPYFGGVADAASNGWLVGVYFAGFGPSPYRRSPSGELKLLHSQSRLYGINAQGLAVGSYLADALIYTRQDSTYILPGFPGAYATAASAVNNCGTIIGSALDLQNRSHALRWPHRYCPR